jgi:hypothetical protein
MKKLILAVIMCFAFSLHATASSIDAKLKRCEILKEKINALKLERKNIEDKILVVKNEKDAALKKHKEIVNRFQNYDFLSHAYSKVQLEESENNFEISKLYAAIAKFRLGISKINLNLNKT